MTENEQTTEEKKNVGEKKKTYRMFEEKKIVNI